MKAETINKNFQEKELRPFGWKDKFGYLMGDFGCNMSFTLISSFMFVFFTQYIGIELMHYATIILVSKIFDAINDPIVGSFVDRCKPKNGDRFRPWILWTSFPLAISATLLFIDTSSWAYGAKIMYCSGVYILWSLFYTMMNVPYGSMNGVITSNSVERSQLSSARTFGALLGAVPIGMLIPVFAYEKVMVDGVEISVFQGENMLPIAIVLSIISIIALQILYRFSIERVKHEEVVKKEYNYFKTLKSFLTNRATLGLSLASLAQAIFISSAAQLTQMTYQMYFGDGKLASLNPLVLLVPMLIGAPLVKPLVAKYGKKEVASYPLIGTILIYVSMLVLPISSPIVWITLLIIANTFSIGYMLVGWAMMSDAIDYMYLTTGRRDEGTIYATYTMVRKLGQGLGQALIPIIIAVIIPGIAMNDVSTWNVEHAAEIKNLAVILPLLGNIIMFICYGFIYNLDDNKVKEMQVELNK
ncbi:MAG: MFS transporter [Peptostreptococcaceae bacterium]